MHPDQRIVLASIDSAIVATGKQEASVGNLPLPIWQFGAKNFRAQHEHMTSFALSRDTKWPTRFLQSLNVRNENLTIVLPIGRNMTSKHGPSETAEIRLAIIVHHFVEL